MTGMDLPQVLPDAQWHHVCRRVSHLPIIYPPVRVCLRALIAVSPFMCLQTGSFEMLGRHGKNVARFSAMPLLKSYNTLSANASGFWAAPGSYVLPVSGTTENCILTCRSLKPLEAWTVKGLLRRIFLGHDVAKDRDVTGPVSPVVNCPGHHYLHNNTDFYTLEGEPAASLAAKERGVLQWWVNIINR